ncbi:hypothetical protein ONZ45_g6712 [Pleurotus djamor]|nr:hypothetical protein ONZ45_g6712 [Pleurotus djamor]
MQFLALTAILALTLCVSAQGAGPSGFVARSFVGAPSTGGNGAENAEAELDLTQDMNLISRRHASPDPLSIAEAAASATKGTVHGPGARRRPSPASLPHAKAAGGSGQPLPGVIPRHAARADEGDTDEPSVGAAERELTQDVDRISRRRASPAPNSIADAAASATKGTKASGHARRVIAARAFDHEIPADGRSIEESVVERVRRSRIYGRRAL